MMVYFNSMVQYWGNYYPIKLQFSWRSSTLFVAEKAVGALRTKTIFLMPGCRKATLVDSEPQFGKTAPWAPSEEAPEWA